MNHFNISISVNSDVINYIVTYSNWNDMIKKVHIFNSENCHNYYIVTTTE